MTDCDAHSVARDSEQHQIQQVITTVHARFDGRPLREFVPLFVERAARAELRDPSLLGV
jgi:hypothetical protein